MSQHSAPEFPARRPLRDLGEIRAGYTQRTRPSPSSDERYWRSLQARDVEDDGSVDWDSLGHIAAPTALSRYEVRAGDVLIPLRSARVQAVTWNEVPSGLVAVGHWAMLTPSPRFARPEYIVVYLNQPSVRARLSNMQRGASIQFLSMKDLKAFPVDVPTRAVQEQIVRVAALHDRVVHLEEELSQARAKLVRAVIDKAANPTVQRRTF